jgi:hypothetical protein
LTISIQSSAQLSEKAIDEITAIQVDKWAQYLSLSYHRKTSLSKVLKQHEQNRNSIFHTTKDLKSRLESENQRFKTELSKVLTENEILIFTKLEQLRFDDDQKYLESLLKAVTNDSIFINAYTNLQYSKIFPFNMIVRMELEESISEADKKNLDTYRNDILGLYDKCLLTCLINDHDTSNQFDHFDELIIVELNKGLSNTESSISKLVKLTTKYEDNIHDVYIKHKSKFDYWDKVTDELKSKYILESYNKSIKDLRKKNNYAALRHIESEAIFLLLDPFDHPLSRKLYNLKLYNQL